MKNYLFYEEPENLIAWGFFDDIKNVQFLQFGASTKGRRSNNMKKYFLI